MCDGSHSSIILLFKSTEFNSLSKSNLYYHHLTENLNLSKLYLTYKLGLISVVEISYRLQYYSCSIISVTTSIYSPQVIEDWQFVWVVMLLTVHKAHHSPNWIVLSNWL